MSLSFHSPHVLWLLVPLVLLFSWELARHTAEAAQRWPQIIRAWAGAFDVTLGARHTTAENRPRIWLWFGLAFCVIALARPQWGTVEEQVFDQSREVLIAVDLSRSMLTQDVKPSRLERSKLLIASLLDHLKGERVGLVVFSGTSFLQSPLSADYEILREFLPEMTPDFLPEGGTNYRALLDTATQAFGTSTADRYLIILSDGEATDDDWKQLVDSLKTKGIRVIGLGVGTAQGGFIPDGSGGFLKDERGAVVLSRLESGTLQELAQTTGGAYADASGWVDLPALLGQTIDAGRKGQFSERNTARLIERFQWFLAPGLLLLLVSFWSEFPVRPRERALPLASFRPRAPIGVIARTGLIVTLFAVGAGLAAFPTKLRAEDNAFAQPLVALAGRLAGQDELSARDHAELAETTITYGQRMQETQQHPSPEVLRDALAAVNAGEKLDARAADWPKLRQQLEEMLKKDQPPPPKPEDKKQDEQKQDQQKNQNEQNQQQQQNQQQNRPQNNQSQSPQDQNQPQQQPKPSNANQPQKAFGDMKDSPQDQQPKPQQAKPTEAAGQQKIGGKKDQPSPAADNPELIVPMQKLEKVKNQDAPVRLQMLLRGEQEKEPQKGKNW